MTAQINDEVFHRKIGFNMAGISGAGLFEPKDHGFEPVAMCTACWRGYYVRYAIENGHLLLTRVTMGLSPADTAAVASGKGPQLLGRSPHYEEEAWGWVYDGLQHPIPFTGGLLLGTEFIRDLYVHMGFHPAWKYRQVREVIFEQGRVTADVDRSEQMEELRARLATEPLRPGASEGRDRIQKWVEECFSREYLR